jgi:hypothetical protein
VAVVLILVGVTGGALWLCRQVHDTRTTRCITNLSQVAIAAATSLREAPGRLPCTLETFARGHVAIIYVCPATGHTPGSLGNVSVWTDYVYVGNLQGHDPAGAVLAYCPPPNHQGRCAVVVRLGGSVQALSPGEFAALTNTPEAFFGTTATQEVAEILNRVTIGGAAGRRFWTGDRLRIGGASAGIRGQPGLKSSVVHP